MAIDLYSENNSGTTTITNNITISPRISFSFSHDFSQSDTVPVEQLLRSLSSSSTDFNFCIHQNPNHHHDSTADELFSDGKLIPSQIKQHPPPAHQTPPSPVNDGQPISNQLNSDQPSSDQLNSDQPNSSKSFWRFKRSSSCGNGYGRSLCPITLLSRSNSTGSSVNSKRSSNSKDHKHHHHHHPNFQKPPLRKTSYSYGNSNSNSVGNGVRINPVINLGFGSLFASGKKK